MGLSKTTRNLKHPVYLHCSEALISRYTIFTLYKADHSTLYDWNVTAIYFEAEQLKQESLWSLRRLNFHPTVRITLPSVQKEEITCLQQLTVI